jgi:hypothetical protein
VIYQDLPDLIELGISARFDGWSADSTAYASPTAFREDARRLLAWVSSPTEPVFIEAGADTGIGWMLLKFYTVDRAGHAFCAVTLSSGRTARTSRRFAIEIPTELGMVERFAHECLALSTDFSHEARLPGLPA